MTPASDVYSFAILMYELYTCKHLFKGMLHSQVSKSCTLSAKARPVSSHDHCGHDTLKAGCLASLPRCPCAKN